MSIIIDIQGGEPLFIKDARIFFETATQQGKKVNLLTNGTIMDVETARRIAVSSTFINFSLNAATPATHEIVNKGSNWQKVMENITVVKNARDELKSPLIIHGHFTIIPENCAEIAKFIEMFPEFNFDTIDFGYDYKFPYYLKIHPRLKKKLKTDVSHAFENSAQKAKINTLRLRHLGFITTSNLEETISVE
jgi:MoaA/NifB/PqqE/SkfB family radical SAM enzyme